MRKMDCRFYQKVKVGDSKCEAQRLHGTGFCLRCDQLEAGHNQLEAGHNIGGSVTPPPEEGETMAYKPKKSGEFKCSKCGKKFMSEKCLANHEKRCSGKPATPRSRKSRLPAPVRSAFTPGIFRLVAYNIQLNPDATLEELRELRARVEDAIRAKL